MKEPAAGRGGVSFIVSHWPQGENIMRAVLSVLGLLVAMGEQAPVRVAATKDGKGIEVVAVLPEHAAAKLAAGKLTQDDGEAWLQFHLVDGGKEGPAMLGTYERRGRDLLFVPRFPLQPEKLYRARLTAPGAAAVVAEYKVPARPPAPAPKVEAIWPTADVLPANHLRFYIQFNRPMLGGEEIFSAIELLDSDGQLIYDPWLPDELWDDSGTMLTLYIHPGRIKWGVLLRDLLGPVLEPKRSYTLVIRGSLLDADGRKLGKDFTKKFKTTAEDRTRIELAKWKLTAPKAGGKDTLKLAFGKVLDHVGAERFLKVVDAKGQPVAGKALVARDGSSWAFQPSASWTTQEYKIVVDAQLEDVAGNTPLHAFDVDADGPVLPAQSLSLMFRPR
jgi:hypothetical protein